MKRIYFNVLYALFSIPLLSQSISPDNFYNELELLMRNPTDINRNTELVMVKIDDIKSISPNFNLDAFLVYENGYEIPNQIFTDNGTKKIAFVTDLQPNEKKLIKFKYLQEGKLRKEYVSRTYAELAMKFDAVYEDKKFVGDEFQNFTRVIVPEIHTDHDALFKYEGPGWESEKVGYRFYLDWRNATDIFGKKVHELVLNKVGINDVIAKDDSYHEMQEWGMDIFKVGQSLGIGSIAMTDQGKINMVSESDKIICEITANGPVISEVKTEYHGWKVGEKKYDLTSFFNISAGSRITNAELMITGGAENITTGLAKHENTVFIKSETDDNWQYIALYGKQALSEDDLGIVIFYEKKYLIELGEDEQNYFVKLVPNKGLINYKFAAAWEQELNGIKNFNEFQKYVDNMLEKLNYPVIIEIK